MEPDGMPSGPDVILFFKILVAYKAVISEFF